MKDETKKLTNEQAKKLLKAVFNSEKEEPTIPSMPEDFPITLTDKVGYAEYVLTHSLGNIGKSLNRLSRLYGLLIKFENDEQNPVPDIIVNNELRMALEPLTVVKEDFIEITEMLLKEYHLTKPSKEEGGK